MADYNLTLPKMGESIAEATVVKWLKQPGDMIAIDEAVLEIATDKVDSEVISPIAGRLIQQLYKEGETVQVEEVLAILEIATVEEAHIKPEGKIYQKESDIKAHQKQALDSAPITEAVKVKDDKQNVKSPLRFYSPLVRNIALEEGISFEELHKIPGTGAEGRLTKEDLLHYIKLKLSPSKASQHSDTQKLEAKTHSQNKETSPCVFQKNGEDEVIEMDRTRKLIAQHMLASKQTSAHVTSFMEVDVSHMVQWYNRIKKNYEKHEGEKITLTPLFVEATVKAISEFPMINVSVAEHHIIKKRNIHIGIATALPSGNLIVPVIKNADQLNLKGLVHAVNDLSTRARADKLKPYEVQEGTFTISNIGSFGNTMGTPIINQPQVAILAIGAIKKKPAVIEAPDGDMIAIRSLMFLSLSYDHRVVDGALGGMFIKRIAHHLENWDIDREI